jgi:hypothetical protein
MVERRQLGLREQELRLKRLRMFRHN